jgi:hypothetical protein
VRLIQPVYAGRSVVGRVDNRRKTGRISNPPQDAILPHRYFVTGSRAGFEDTPFWLTISVRSPVPALLGT